MPRNRKSDGEDSAPHPVDVTAGRNLRIARFRAGMTQTSLANAAGITFQQIQKYERGTNRMSLSRASELAKILRINVADFFDDPEWLPAEGLLGGPHCAEWMALYTRARYAGRVDDIITFTEHLLRVCEPSTQEPVSD